MAAGAPWVIPGRALGKDGSVAPGNRITMGCIGLGWMGPGNLSAFLNEKDCQVLAVCDIDRQHLTAARQAVDRHYGNHDCAATAEMLDVIGRDDIDALSLALPDHWHAVAAVLGARAGKDIYGEKPFAHSLHEGRIMADTLKRYGRVWQTGSWQRSVSNFYQAVAIVRSGRIGKIKSVEVGLPSGVYQLKPEDVAKREPPPQFDYDRWLGPAPWSPYAPCRVHVNWRWVLDFGGGQLMDWVGHHLDIAHWGMDCDTTGPVQVYDAKGTYLDEWPWDCATSYSFQARYRNGIEMTVSSSIRGGTKWIGEEGWVWVNRGGIEAEPKSLLKLEISPGEAGIIRSPNHYRNFLDCVKSRELTITPAEVAHRSASVGQLGQIALRLRRDLRWNPETEEIIGDPEAARLLGNAMRPPWSL
jgi:predicted dehydrogenase